MRHSLGERERSGAFQSNRNRLGARTVKTGDTGVIPAATSVLAELDQTQAELQSEFPGWRIWYVYRPGKVSWAARPEPLLNTQSAEDLRAAIAKVLANDSGDVSKDLLSMIADEGTEDD